MRWFDATHALEERHGRRAWRRTGLPGPGSIGAQDARLMDALDLLRDVHDDLVKPRANRRNGY